MSARLEKFMGEQDLVDAVEREHKRIMAAGDYPDIRTVAERLGVCRKAVERVRKRLKAEGRLVVPRHPGRGGRRRRAISPAPVTTDPELEPEAEAEDQAILDPQMSMWQVIREHDRAWDRIMSGPKQKKPPRVRRPQGPQPEEKP